jgi:hypothetical protein
MTFHESLAKAVHTIKQATEPFNEQCPRVHNFSHAFARDIIRSAQFKHYSHGI